MNPNPIKPPEGYEILTPDFLRKYGAVEGMKWNTIYDNGFWNDFHHAEIQEAWIKNCYFSAPLGTSAMLSTPLPEIRCECVVSPHRVTCPAHPRNRRVKVLPEWLAKCETKPEGLEWAEIGIPEWQPFPYEMDVYHDSYAPGQIPQEDEGPYDLAFSVPLSVWQKMEADRKEARSYENYKKVHQPDLARAEGPTDGELLRYHYESHHRRKYTFDQWRDCLCKEYLTSAMQKEGTK